MSRIVITLVVLSAVLVPAYFSAPDCASVIERISWSCSPSKVQMLDSRGGSIRSAMRTGSRADVTFVTGECLSACVIVASAGKRRFACHDSVYGFHSASPRWANYLFQDYFYGDERIKSGIVMALIDSTPSHKMTTVGAYGAINLGLVDEVVRCDDENKNTAVALGEVP